MRPSRPGSGHGERPAIRTRRTRRSPRSWATPSTGELNLDPAEVQDVYFTGAITDPGKTDLSFAYQHAGRERRYTPDFLVHARGDRWLLVEIKMTARRDDPVEGRDGLKAQRMRDLEQRNPGRVVYRIVFADEVVAANDVEAVRAFLADESRRDR